MATTAYELLPVPSYTGPTHTYTDPEILFSTATFTQVGVTLAGGQGVIAAGTVLAQKTADKKYYVYSNAGSGGIDTARGVLRKAADTGLAGSPDQQGNMVISAILKLSLIVGADAAALTDLGGTVNSVLGTLKI
jgi:hypothetical protein